MYKGIILKVTTEYAVVMTDDKVFCKILLKEGLVPGKKIFFFDEDKLDEAANQEERSTLTWLRDWGQKTAASLIAACLMLFFLINGMIGDESNSKEYFAVISMDINPSIELKLNKSGYVNDVEALNREAKEVSGNYLIGLKADKAVSLIIENAAKKNYLNEEQDTILIATAVVNSDSVEGDELTHQIMEMNILEEYSVILIPMQMDGIDKAEAKGLSLGKYAILEISEGGLEAEVIRKMKVKELITSDTIEEKLNQKEKEKIIKKKNKKDKKDKKGKADNPRIPNNPNNLDTTNINNKPGTLKNEKAKNIVRIIPGSFPVYEQKKVDRGRSFWIFEREFERKGSGQSAKENYRGRTENRNSKSP